MKISNLIYREDRWMKGGLAKTKTGVIIQDLNIYHYANGKKIDPAAECDAFSLHGAAASLYTGDGLGDVLIKLGNTARDYCGRKIYLAEFNDLSETTFKDVQNVLKFANL